MFVFVLIFAAFVEFASPVLAADRLPELPPSSVYQVSGLKDGGVILAATLANLLPTVYASKLLMSRAPSGYLETSPAERIPLGNRDALADSLSDVTALASVLAPVALDVADIGAGSELVKDMVVYGEALAVSGAFATVAKNSPSILGQTDQQSSANTTLVFSALSAASITSNLRHHSGIWPWLVTGAVGSSVAVERAASGRQFTTDLAVGMGAGIAVGVLVPLFHAERSSQGETITVLPLENGAQLVWTRSL